MREVRNWADRLDDVGKTKFPSINAWNSTFVPDRVVNTVTSQGARW